MTKAELIRAIVGAELGNIPKSNTRSASLGKVVLELDQVSRLPRVKDVTLGVRQGEVLGLAGLVGAGRTELARLIFGADALEEGEMRLEGEAFFPKLSTRSCRAWGGFSTRGTAL